MAKAKKLPSGSYRALVYSHKDPNGKRVYVSFTASTKREAEMKAAVYAAKKTKRTRGDITVADAVESYISGKSAVLSPSTLRAYRSLQRTAFTEINKTKAHRLTPSDVQNFVSNLSSRVGAKTVHNSYSLLCASLRLSNVSIDLSGITLPSTKKTRPEAPSDADIIMLYNAAPKKLKLAIALAAFGSLRRGEICAIMHKDVVGNQIFIHADMVMGEKGCVYKDYPKTSESVRTVTLPQEIIALIGDGEPDGFVCGYRPTGLSAAYERLRKKYGISIKFHDLRHYYASIGAVLNIPDIYLASFGGWRQDSPVMKQVYQNKITPAADQYAKKMTDHFSNLLGESCNT